MTLKKTKTKTKKTVTKSKTEQLQKFIGKSVETEVAKSVGSIVQEEVNKALDKIDLEKMKGGAEMELLDVVAKRAEFLDLLEKGGKATMDVTVKSTTTADVGVLLPLRESTYRTPYENEFDRVVAMSDIKQTDTNTRERFMRNYHGYDKTNVGIKAEGEAAGKVDLKPTNKVLSAYKRITAQTEISHAYLMASGTAFDEVVEDLMAMVQEKFVHYFFYGDATLGWKGILTSTNFAKVPLSDDPTLQYKQVVRFLNTSVPFRYANRKLHTSQTGASLFDEVVDDTGRPIFNDSTGKEANNAGVVGRVKGYDVNVFSAIAPPVATGDVIAAYGDMKAASWGGLLKDMTIGGVKVSLTIDPYTLADAGMVRVIANVYGNTDEFDTNALAFLTYTAPVAP